MALARTGRFESVGIAQMLRGRGAAAGIKGLHPHPLRHTWAHNREKQGLSDGDLMVLGGWPARSMIDRYGAAGAQERAIAAGKALEEL